MPLYIFNHWDADEEECLIWAGSISFAEGSGGGTVPAGFGWDQGWHQGRKTRPLGGENPTFASGENLTFGWGKTQHLGEEEPDLWLWERGWSRAGAGAPWRALQAPETPKVSEALAGSERPKPGWARKILAQPLPQRDDCSPLSFLSQFSLIFKPVSLSPLWTHLILFAILAVIIAKIIRLYPTANSGSPESSSPGLISHSLPGKQLPCPCEGLALDTVCVPVFARCILVN